MRALAVLLFVFEHLREVDLLERDECCGRRRRQTPSGPPRSRRSFAVEREQAQQLRDGLGRHVAGEGQPEQVAVVEERCRLATVCGLAGTGTPSIIRVSGVMPRENTASLRGLLDGVCQALDGRANRRMIWRDTASSARAAETRVRAKVVTPSTSSGASLTASG